MVRTAVNETMSHLQLDGKTPNEMIAIRSAQAHLLSDAFKEIAQPESLQIHLDTDEQVAITQALLINILFACVDPNLKPWNGVTTVQWDWDVIKPQAAQAIALRYRLDGSEGEAPTNKEVGSHICPNPITGKNPDASAVSHLIGMGLAVLGSKYRDYFVHAGIVSFEPKPEHRVEVQTRRPQW